MHILGVICITYDVIIVIIKITLKSTNTVGQAVAECQAQFDRYLVPPVLELYTTQVVQPSTLDR
jgi:hypothetical protein